MIDWDEVSKAENEEQLKKIQKEVEKAEFKIADIKKGERIKFDIIESRDSDNVNYGRWVDEERDVQKKVDILRQKY